MQYIDAEGRIKTGAVESTDHDGVPQIEYGVEDDEGTGVYLLASADSPGFVQVSTSYLETVTARLTAQEALDLAVELIRVALWARDTPLIAMHGPPYPPPGWIILDGVLIRDPLSERFEQWAALAINPVDTPFLSTIMVGDYRADVMEWGVRAPVEEDEDA